MPHASPNPALRRSSLAALAAIGLVVSLAPRAQATTGSSLDIPPGGRQNALGEAGVALVGNPAGAMWWNPAALAWTDRVAGEFTRSKLLPGLADDVLHYHVATAAPIASWGGFGTSFTHLSYGDVGPFFTPSSENSPAIGLGIRVMPALAIGATVKWVHVQFGPSGGDAFAGDVGVLWRDTSRWWTYAAGASYRSFGGRVDFAGIGGTASLAHDFKLGASLELPRQLSPEATLGAIAVADFNQWDVESDYQTWGGGLEGYVTSTDLLRVAARLGYYSDERGDISDLTFGAGVRIREFSIDGGWIPQAKDSGLDRVFKLTFAVQVPIPSGAN